MEWVDRIKDLIVFDPNVPCKDCIIRMICSDVCNAKYLSDWSNTKLNRWCKYMIEKDKEEYEKRSL